ncbi:hypothetical protein K2173_004645 [Erythroxylum novogranatense]|uniref:Uncharacterized protein n=1 Tax=Erythroxylum novogranatense TaxID=1862640 RepID=A0AAV8SXK5_9ROSI|nr:hypothetical protein K2173_004645 [Erythroxylum novogranatense]
MGNCIRAPCFSQTQKSRVLIYNGGEAEFKASTSVENITSGYFSGYVLVHHNLPFAPLPPKTKLEPGEVYYLMPPIKHPVCRQIAASKLGKPETCRKQKLRIVLTRQQLELLLGNDKKCKPKADRKWQPSLATIPEFATDQVHGDKPGEGLLDYVSGRPEHFQEPREYDS